MKAAGCTTFGLFALLAISLMFACKQFVNCSFADEKSGSTDAPLPGVNVLPPSLPSLSSGAAPCNAELPMVQAPFAEMLPCELWQEIFSFCSRTELLSCFRVCRLWKNIVMKHELYVDVLCLLVDENEANFERLLLVLEQKSREELKVLLQRIHDEKLVPQKGLMDLIVRLFMVDDVFPIVTDLLRDPSIPMSKMFERECWPFLVDRVLADPQRAVRRLELTPELLDVVFKHLTPENWHHWLVLTSIFKQLMEKAIEENTALALRIYQHLKGAVRLLALVFPTLSCIEPLLPLIFPVPELFDEKDECITFSPRLYLQLTKLQRREKVTQKGMASRILDILSLVEINEQSMRLLVPYLCPSFLKGWKEREAEVGKPVITLFLNILEKFKRNSELARPTITEFLNILEKFIGLNDGVDYGQVLMSTDLSVIQRAINSLSKIDSVPFFVYRPLIVRFLYWMTPYDSYDAAQVPFSGIEYSPCFMEDLCVLVLRWPNEVHAFLKFLDHKQRSSLVSYSSVLTNKLLSHFEKLGLNCAVLSATPSSP